MEIDVPHCTIVSTLCRVRECREQSGSRVMCCEVTVTVTHRHRPDWYIGSKSRWRHSRSQNSVSITTTPLCLPDELPGEILLRIENPSDLFYLGITFHTFRVSITPLHIPFRRLVICDVLDSVGKDLADKLNLS